MTHAVIHTLAVRSRFMNLSNVSIAVYSDRAVIAGVELFPHNEPFNFLVDAATRLNTSHPIAQPRINLRQSITGHQDHIVVPRHDDAWPASCEIAPLQPKTLGLSPANI